jgi:hypothetical protein
MAIYDYSKLFWAISNYFTLGYFRLFHLRLFSAIVSFFCYCKLFHFRLYAIIISFLAILSYFISNYFKLGEAIVGYFGC